MTREELRKKRKEIAESNGYKEYVPKTRAEGTRETVRNPEPVQESKSTWDRIQNRISTVQNSTAGRFLGKELEIGRNLGKRITNPTQYAIEDLNKTARKGIRTIKEGKTDLVKGWVDKGAFSNGYQFGDVTRTAVGTTADITKQAFKGAIAQPGEALGDLMSIAQAGYNEYIKGDKKRAEAILRKASEDHGDDIASGALGALGTAYKYLGKGQKAQLLLELGQAVAKGGNVGQNLKDSVMNTFRQKYGYYKNVGEDSLLGEAGEETISSMAKNARQRFLQDQLAIPWQTQMFAETMPETYLQKRIKEGLTPGQSVASSLADFSIEWFTEEMFDGIKLKGTGNTTINKFLDANINKLQDNFERTTLKYLKGVYGEATEEVVGAYMSALSDYLIKHYENKDWTMEDIAQAIKDVTMDPNTWKGAISAGLSVGGQTIYTLGGDVRGIYRNEQRNQAIIDSSLSQEDKQTLIDSMEYEAPEKPSKKEIQKQEEMKGEVDKILNKLDGEEKKRVQSALEQGDISSTIQESELDENQKNTLSNIAQKYQLTLDEIQTAIEKTKNGEYALDELTRTQNEETSEQEQQITQAEGKPPQNETSNEIGLNLRKSIDAYNNSRTEGQKIFDINDEDTRKEIDAIQKVAEKRGLNVTFDESRFNNNRINAFYEYDDDGNVAGIVLNPNTATKKYVQNLVVHEMTHSFEGSKEYEKLSKAVLDYAKSKGEYKNAIQDLKNTYAGVYSGEKLNKVVEKEAVANILGEKLGSKEFINDLVNGTYSQENRNLVQKIYDFVKNQINRFKGYKDQEAYWNNVKKLFDEAYNKSEISRGQEDYSTEAYKMTNIKDSDDRNLSQGQVEYFKDSKVRDENGNLKTVYHGANLWSGEKKFTIFDFDKAGSHGQLLGRGMYFTDNKDGTKQYSNNNEDNVYEVYLNLKNPYGVDKTSGSFSENFLQDFSEDLKKYAQINNYTNLTNYQLLQYTNAITSILKKNGYDGVDWMGDYVAFNPEQIKNIDNLNPTEDPDIRYSSDSRRKLPEGNEQLELDLFNEVENGQLTFDNTTNNEEKSNEYEQESIEDLTQETEKVEEKEEKKEEKKLPEAKKETTAKMPRSDKIEDFGEKIGLARKDLAMERGTKPAGKPVIHEYAVVSPEEYRESMKKRYVIFSDEKAQIDGYGVTFKGKLLTDGFKTQQQAEDFILKFKENLKSNMAFVKEFEKRDGSKVYRIYVRNPRNPRVADDINKEFTSRADAESFSIALSVYLKEHGKNIFRPQIQKVTRENPNNNNAKKATGENILNDFGFRGGEFGNWVTNNERQEFLNYAQDAFNDLSDALGIDAKSLGQNGNMAIAFGARGKGLTGAVAHFEPQKKVINMTRLKGAGSLAHEYGHSIDNFLSRIAGYDVDGMVTRQDSFRWRNLPEKMKTAITNVTNALKYSISTDEEEIRKKNEIHEKNRIDNLEYHLKRLDQLFDGKVTKYERNRKTKEYESVPVQVTQEQKDKYKAIREKLMSGTLTEQATYKFGSGTNLKTTYPEPISTLQDLYKEVYGRKLDDDTVYGIYNRSRPIQQVKEVRSESAYSKSAREIDKLFNRKTPYYADIAEMWARGFEAYVSDKLKAKGIVDTYLVNSVNNVDYALFNPYPAGEERKTINKAFDELIKAMKEEGYYTTSTRPDNVRYSIETSSKENATDSQGRTLSKQQQEYFKDSKVRDENGNLLEVYHGTENAGFTIFDPEMSDDGTSLFFTDNINVAKGYSGNTKIINKKLLTYETVKKKIEKLSDRYTKYRLTKDEDEYTLESASYKVSEDKYTDWETEETGSLQDILDYMGIEQGTGNYATYLNITNPYIVDAQNNYWDEIVDENISDEMITTRDIAQYAKENGYDGVIVKNVIDTAIYASNSEKTQPATDYIVFDSNQVKDTNNKNPTTNPDIRYSIESSKDSDGKELSKGQQEYFKDSKARNEDGNLLRLYHSTDADFTIFDKEKLGDNTFASNTGYGFFLTPNKSFSERFKSEKGKTMEVYADIKNPIIHPYMASQKYSKAELDNITRTWLEATDNTELLDVINEDIENGDATGLWDGYMNMTVGEDIFEPSEYERESLQKKGYDGIELVEGIESELVEGSKSKEPVSSYIVFDSNQIKNIDNANPTTNEDIRYSQDVTGAWNNFIEKYFKTEGTGTAIKDMKKLPQRVYTPKDFEDVLNSAKNIPQESKEAMRVDFEGKTLTKEMFEDWKKTVQQADEGFKTMNLDQGEERFNSRNYLDKDRRSLIAKKIKEFNRSMDYDDSVVTELDEITPRNRNGKRTVEQWKNIAKQLGQRIANMSPEQIEDIAVKSYLDLQPTKAITRYDSQTKTNKGFEQLYANDWVNEVYEGVRENRQFSMDAENQAEKIEDEKPKPKVLNPTQISNLTLEDASTTPKLPSKNYKKGTKISNFVSNIENDVGFLNEEEKQELLKDDNVKYYAGITNADTLAKAYDNLKENGKDATLKWYSKPTANATAEDVATGWILLKQYSDEGDTEGMVNVAKKLRDMGTKAGQTVQAFNILSRLTPEGMVAYTQGELQDAYNEMIKGKSKKWIDQHKSDFDLSQDEIAFIMDTMQNLPAEDPTNNNYDRKVALGQIQKLFTDKIPSENNKIKAWMRISMLFNPKTQVRNVTGNAGVVPVNMTSDFLGSKVDKILSKYTGVRTLGNPNAKAYLKGMKEGFYQSYNDFKLGINTRDIEQNKFEFGQGKAFKDKGIGKALNRVDNMLNFIMDFGDRGFSQASFVNSLNNQMLLNGVTTPTQEMIDIATQEALSRTWNDNNEYTKFVLGVRRALNKVGTKNYGLGDVLIPFAKTPANLTKAIVEYSPVGLTKQILNIKDIKNAIETGQFTAQQQHEFADKMGKGLAGTLLYVAGYALAQAGIATGEPDEDKDVKNFMKNSLGIAPYSIKIGDKSFTYDWSQPVATPLAIMTNLYQTNKNNPDATMLDKIMSATNIGTNQLMEQSFMESLNEVLNGNGEITERIQKAILDLPARAIPTFSKQIADMVDGTQRTSFEYGQPVKSAINSAKAKLPFVSKELTPVVDTLGNEVEKYGGENNWFNVFFNPANMNKGKKTKAGEEIYNVYQETGDTTIFPVTAPYYVNQDGAKITMDSKQRAEYQKTAGDYTEETVNKLINDSDYQKLDDPEKAEILSQVVKDSNEKAKRDVLNINNKSSDLELIDKVGADYYTYKIATKGMKTDAEQCEALERKNYSNQNKQLIYESEINKDDKTFEGLKKINKNFNMDEYLKYKTQKFSGDTKKEDTINYVNGLNLNGIERLYIIGRTYKLKEDRELFESLLKNKMPLQDVDSILQTLK